VAGQASEVDRIILRSRKSFPASARGSAVRPCRRRPSPPAPRKGL
jgi:hypothetical protein